MALWRLASLPMALLAAGCGASRNIDRIVERQTLARQTVGQVTPPDVELPSAQPGEATVVVQVVNLDEARVVLLGAGAREQGRLVCRATPCAFTLPAGEHTLEISARDQEAREALDRVEVRLEAGEELLIAHRATEVRESVVRDRSSDGLVAGAFATEFVGWFVAASGLILTLPGAGGDWNPGVSFAGGALALGGSAVGVTGYLLPRRRQLKQTIEPGATSIRRYRPPSAVEAR